MEGLKASATESAVRFLTTHASIKSTVMIDSVREKLLSSKDRWEFFTIPVVARLLGYEKSLVWMHFVQSQPHLNDMVGDFNFPWGAFELHNAMSFLSKVHDLSYDELVTTHSMEDSDDESGDEESEGEDEESEGEDEGSGAEGV